MRAPARPVANVRLAGLRAALLLAVLVLAARAAHLAILDPRGGQRVARQTHTTLRLAPARGLIVDRSGKELAVGTQAPSVYASPDEVQNPAVTARALARVLGGDAERIRQRLRGSGRFAFVARWVSPADAERIAALDLPGVGIVHEPRRAYPAGALGSAVLGFANIDGRGVRGIEQLEDDWLSGTAQRVPVERDARGRLMARTAVAGDATRGGDVMLTLDAALQSSTEAALRETVERTRARGGVVVVLDPHSGDVLALAETPSFDPNRFRETDYRATRSRAFLDAWEPGSTFKVFLAAAALEAGAVAEHELIDCAGGSYRIPGKTIRDTHPHDLLPLEGVIRVSSNVGAVKLAERLGAESHYRALEAFGFGSPSGSGFPDESSGLLRPWQSWRPVDHATIAFGQGVAVTPVQLAAATAALANGGERLTPRLVAARREPGGRWRDEPAAARRRVVSAHTARAVLTMMEGVVSGSGTGRRAGLRGVRVAGKTGTAQKLDPRTGAYSRDRYVAWFIGAAPAEDPRLVAVVAIDEPAGPAHSGGAVAAPLFARVAAAHLGAWDILTEPEPVPRAEPVAVAEAVDGAEEADEPDATSGPDATAETARTGSPAAPQREPSQPARVVSADDGRPAAPAQVSTAPPVAVAADPIVSLEGDERRVLLPDFHGLTVEEVERLTREARLSVEITGRGRAVSQDPEPGTILVGAERRVRVSFEPAPSQGGEG